MLSFFSELNRAERVLSVVYPALQGAQRQRASAQTEIARFTAHIENRWIMNILIEYAGWIAILSAVAVFGGILLLWRFGILSRFTQTIGTALRWIGAGVKTVARSTWRGVKAFTSWFARVCRQIPSFFRVRKLPKLPTWKLPKWKLPTKEHPYAIDKIQTIVFTSFLAGITGILGATFLHICFAYAGIFGGMTWTSFAIDFLVAAFVTSVLITDERTKVAVPARHAAIPMWLQERIGRFYLQEGIHFIPWWFWFSISRDPVPKTIIYSSETDESDDASLARKDLGHFTPEEGRGFVFMNERLMEAHVSVQSSDLVETKVEANHVLVVESPYLWQGADNPFGTVQARFEAGLRMGVAAFNSEDTFTIRSLFPWLLNKGSVCFARVTRANGPFVPGDVVRKETGERIYLKRKRMTKNLRATLLETLNREADPRCKPSGGFTESHLEALDLSGDLQTEMHRLGGVTRSFSIEDITVPEEAQNAGVQLLIERRQRDAEVYEAETRVQTTNIMATGIRTKQQKEARDQAMVEAGKATLVIGKGTNLIAQLAGMLQPRKG